MSTGIKVARLAHVGLRARDLGRQAEFYTDRWGLEPIEEHGSDGSTSSTTTVFRASPIDGSAASPITAVGGAGKPLAGNGFNQSAIYARRSPGVVTLVSVYGQGQRAPRLDGPF